MTDAEFVDELVTRLNLTLEADQNRANSAFSTPLGHAGYASVAHFIGQLGMPRGINETASADDVLNVKFIVPIVEGGRIMGFEGVTGSELQNRHAKAAAEASSNLKE